MANISVSLPGSFPPPFPLDDDERKSSPKHRSKKTEYKPVTHINELPNELFGLIFDYFPLPESALCKRVCRIWNEDYIPNIPKAFFLNLFSPQSSSIYLTECSSIASKPRPLENSRPYVWTVEGDRSQSKLVVKTKEGLLSKKINIADITEAGENSIHSSFSVEEINIGVFSAIILRNTQWYSTSFMMRFASTPDHSLLWKVPFSPDSGENVMYWNHNMGCITKRDPNASTIEIRPFQISGKNGEKIKWEEPFTIQSTKQTGQLVINLKKRCVAFQKKNKRSSNQILQFFDANRRATPLLNIHFSMRSKKQASYWLQNFLIEENFSLFYADDPPALNVIRIRDGRRRQIPLMPVYTPSDTEGYFFIRQCVPSPTTLKITAVCGDVCKEFVFSLKKPPAEAVQNISNCLSILEPSPVEPPVPLPLIPEFFFAEPPLVSHSSLPPFYRRWFNLLCTAMNLLWSCLKAIWEMLRRSPAQ